VFVECRWWSTADRYNPPKLIKFEAAVTGLGVLRGRKERGGAGRALCAKVVIEQWRQHYNEIRPHSSLGNQTPAAFKLQCFSTTQPEAVFQE